MPRSSRMRLEPFGVVLSWTLPVCGRHPALKRIMVGLDPGRDAGIVVVVLGEDGHGYVLDDLSHVGLPAVWAQQAVSGYHKLQANAS